jgi:predicted GIY-YIG superfamily endonuclease
VKTTVVYLLHFYVSYKHARHYLGSTDDLSKRLDQHQAGTGARLLEVIADAGIYWTLSRAWPGDRKRERKLKNYHRRYLCPLCDPHAFTRGKTSKERKEH